MATRAFEDWAQSGRAIDVGGNRIWMADFPSLEPAAADPVFVLHGYPTSSFDWHGVLPTLRAHRRVVVLDLIGFGLSDKPEMGYSSGVKPFTMANLTKLGRSWTPTFFIRRLR